MVKEHILSTKMSVDPEMTQPPLSYYRPLITDDLSYFTFVNIVQMQNLPDFEYDGVLYINRSMLKSLYFSYFLKHPSEEELYEAIIVLIWMDHGMRKLHSGLHTKVTYISDEDWEKVIKG